MLGGVIRCAVSRRPLRHGTFARASAATSTARLPLSPRATRALRDAAQAYAFLKQRHFVTPDDVKAVAYPVLRHRIILSYQAEANHVTTDSVIQKILATVPTP